MDSTIWSTGLEIWQQGEKLLRPCGNISSPVGQMWNCGAAHRLEILWLKEAAAAALGTSVTSAATTHSTIKFLALMGSPIDLMSQLHALVSACREPHATHFATPLPLPTPG